MKHERELRLRRAPQERCEPLPANEWEEETYIPTPKGLALIALMEAELVDSVEDERFDTFWEIFSGAMEIFEYVTVDKER